MRDNMDITEKLNELYAKRDKLIYRIELEENRRNSLGIEEMGPDLFEASIEKENQLVNQLMDIQAEIKMIESQDNVPVNVISGPGLINGFDINDFIDNFMENIKIDPNKRTTIDIRTKTTITVTEEDDDGSETTQQLVKKDQQTITIDDEQEAYDKSSSIKYIIKEVKNGKTIAEAANEINISLSEVNNWLENGKRGKGWDDTVFYEKIKKIENPDKKDSLLIEAKKVYDKTSSIKFIIKEVKKGKTIAEAAEMINVPLSDVKQWYENGKQGKGWDDTVFYEKIMKIESLGNDGWN